MLRNRIGFKLLDKVTIFQDKQQARDICYFVHSL